MAFSQATLPATSTTAPYASTPAVAPATGPNAATHAANVSYTQGLIEIDADNSSLNEILREMGRLTGMKITGGVTDQRVFGKYGPASPADILASLIAGSGSNMLLLNDASNAPAELILTPQNGGATTPNPNTGFENDTPTIDAAVRSRSYYPTAVQPPSRPAYAPAGLSNSGSIPGATAATESTGTGTDSNPNQAPEDNPASPNGAKTPQQIYQQLQQLQKQQQAQPKQ